MWDTMEVTIDTILEELEEARQIALAAKSPTAAISASMGKAKLLGLANARVEEDETERSPKEVRVKFV